MRNKAGYFKGYYKRLSEKKRKQQRDRVATRNKLIEQLLAENIREVEEKGDRML